MSGVQRRITCPNCGETFPDPAVVDIGAFEQIVMAARRDAMNEAIKRFSTGDPQRDEFFRSYMGQRISALIGKSHLFEPPVNLVDFHASKFIPERDLKKAAS